MKRSKTYIIFAIIAFLTIAIYYQWKSSHSLTFNGRYTIGTIEKMTPAGTGIRVYVIFYYKNIKKERDYIEDVGKIKN
jgi:hypothetical protein